VCGVWCVVCGVWCVVCGVWCVVCGVWCLVCGVMLCGVWCDADNNITLLLLPPLSTPLYPNSLQRSPVYDGPQQLEGQLGVVGVGGVEQQQADLPQLARQRYVVEQLRDGDQLPLQLEDSLGVGVG
jgi:hypothetical protein